LQMTKIELESVLRFKLRHTWKNDNAEELDFESFLAYAERTTEEYPGCDDETIIELLTNELREQTKKTYDLTDDRLRHRLNEYFTHGVESIGEDTTKPKTGEEVLQGSLPQDPKEALNDDNMNKRERYDLASEWIARGLQEQHEVRTIFNDDDQRMFFYEDGVFKDNAESKIDQYTRAALGDAHKPTLSQRVISKVRADTYIDKDILFDVNPRYLCVANGVLDLHEEELYEHSADFHHFQKLDVEYDPQSSHDELEAFLEEIVDGREEVELIQEIFGFCLYREYFLKKAVIFHGDADNGKSTVINILQRLLGDDNISGVKLQDLNKRFQKRWLVHNLANIVGDLDSKEVKHTGDFKAVTGGDPIQYEVKNGGAYTFTNYAKFIYSANQLPKVRNPTPAFFSRWIIINFPYTFVETSEYEERKHEDGVKEAEPNPVKRLFDEQGQTLSGVLNFALEGLQRLLDNGEFSYSRSRKENMTEWVRQSSSFQAFCMDCVREEPQRFITKKDLRKAYRKYCKHHNLTHDKDAKFKKDFLIEQFGVTEKKRSVGGSRPRSWIGVRFSDEFEKEWDNLEKNQSQFIFKDTKPSDNVSEASEENIASFSEQDTLFAEDYEYDFEDSKLVSEGAVMETGPGEYEILQPEVVQEVLG